jgi:hypothetical protein
MTTEHYIIIFCVLFALYIVYSLSKLNYRLKLIVKHLGADKEKMVSNEEIEQELKK